MAEPVPPPAQKPMANDFDAGSDDDAEGYIDPGIAALMEQEFKDDLEEWRTDDPKMYNQNMLLMELGVEKGHEAYRNARADGEEEPTEILMKFDWYVKWDDKK